MLSHCERAFNPCRERSRDHTMNADSTDSRAQWHWSHDGKTLGPVDFIELKRLAAMGSITSATWVHDPILSRWIAASSVAGLLPVHAADSKSAEPASGPAPDATSATAPASSSEASGVRTPSSPPTTPPIPPVPPSTTASTSAPVTFDPRVAEILCRIAVLTAPLTNIFAFIGVGIIWGLGASDQRVVAEARQTMNCLLTLGLGVVIAAAVSFVCAIIIIGPFIGIAISAALFVYCVVVGIRGLMAATNGVPFRYPWVIQFIR